MTISAAIASSEPPVNAQRREHDQLLCAKMGRYAGAYAGAHEHGRDVAQHDEHVAERVVAEESADRLDDRAGYQGDEKSLRHAGERVDEPTLRQLFDDVPSLLTGSARGVDYYCFL